MQSWRSLPDKGACSLSRGLFEAWIAKANTIATLVSNGREDHQPSLEELQRRCDNEEVAEFAWMTLKVSRALSCFNNSGMISLGFHEGDGMISDTERLVFTVTFSFVFVAGLFGNLLTVLTICSTPTLYSHTNYFLASLACSDLLLILLGVPFDIAHLWQTSVAHNFPGYCEIMSTSISLFTTVSILTIVGLTVERYFAICYPFSMNILFDTRRVFILLYGIWFFSIFPSLYIGIQFKPVVPDFCGYNRELGEGIGSCDFVANGTMPMQFPFEALMLVAFVFPLCVILFCYIQILRTLSKMSLVTTVHRPSRAISTEEAPNHVQLLYVHTQQCAPSKSQQAQKIVIKMLATVTCVFFVCYLPFHIQRIIVHYMRIECDKSRFCQLLYPTTGVLQYVSAMVNPIIYNLMSLRFRTAFKHRLDEFVNAKRSRLTARAT